jgi:GT2 family glycosyltransferase
LVNSVNPCHVRILAVIVLYKMQPGKSVSFRTLRTTISVLQVGQADIKIVLYDNTPGGQDAGELPEGVQYIRDFENSGLAKAYNCALEIAQEEGFDWLLTLDQDTDLPADFLKELCCAAILVSTLNTIAAIAPSLSSDGRSLSPFILRKHLTLTRHLPGGFVGIPPENVYAINSASTFKVSALRSVGGYDPRFNLDFSDLAVYHRLHQQGFRVFVAGNIHVNHEVSAYDLSRRATPSRYEETYRAEEAAYDEWMGTIGRLVLTARIFHRLIYQLWRNRGGLPHFKIGLRFLCRRLFYSRKHRMESWKQSVSRRLAVK